MKQPASHSRTIYLIVLILVGLFPLYSAPLTTEDLKASLRTNTELLLLQEEITQAQLDVKDAKAMFWPNIELDFSATWMKNPPIGPITINLDNFYEVITGSPPLTPFDPPTVTLYEGMDPFIYSTGITLTQPIFTWGKRSHALKLSEAMVLVKRNQLQNQNRTLFSELETRLASVTHLKAILVLLQQQEQLAQELVALAQQASQSGMLLALEVGETRLQVQQITMAKLEIQHAIDTQILELQRLSGRKDVSATNIFQSYDEETLTSFLETPVSALVDKALAADQPALMAVSTFEKITTEAEKIAKGSFYGKPDVALVINATYGGPKFPIIDSDWQEKDTYDLTVSVGFKTTLWDGGKILNEIRRAASQVEYARIQSQSVRQQIEQEVRKNHAKLSMTVEKLRLQQEKTETLTQRKTLNKQLAQAGLQGRQQTLMAEIAVFASQIEEEQLKIDLSQYINILKALT